MEVKKKKNERKKALEEIKNKLKTEQLIANLRQLNEKSCQLASKRLTIAKHSKTSNLKNLGSMDKKILLTNLSFSDENNKTQEEIAKLYNINRNKQENFAKYQINEGDMNEELKDSKNQNDIIEVQEYFGKIMKRGFNTELRDFEQNK